jgi:hypothetical protein
MCKDAYKNANSLGSRFRFVARKNAFLGSPSFSLFRVSFGLVTGSPEASFARVRFTLLLFLLHPLCHNNLYTYTVVCLYSPWNAYSRHALDIET